jgi:hypothetical protein
MMTDDSRLSNPPCNLRGTGWNRWEWLCLNPQERVEIPFDWNITYNGVSKCIDDNFKFFTEPLNKRINKYDIYFHHNFENINLLNQDKEKYIRRYQRLINILETSNEGDLILDSFLGSGTTAVACINTKRNYIGFELDKRYYEIALKRIKEVSNDPRNTEFKEIILKLKGG